MKTIAKQFLSIFTGTAMSQLIPLIITPVLTRIYDPHDFGVYASYIAVITILFVLSTGRYEMAIVSTQDKDEAVKIGFLSIFFSFIFNLFLSLVLLIFGEYLINIIGYKDLLNYIYLIPISLFFMAIFQVCYYLLNVFEYYKLMGYALIIQSLLIALFNLVIGIYDPKLGLIIGYVIGQFFSAIHILIKTNKLGLIYNNNSYHFIKDTLLKYISYPKYLILSNLSNRFSLQSTVIVFTKYFDSHHVGNYSLTHRILKVPISFIGNSISQLFRQKMSKSSSQGDILKIYFITLFLLASLGLPIFGCIYLFSENIFTVFLGNEWSEAGKFAKILVPMLYAQFCIAPLSAMFLFENNQKYDLIWQFISLIVIFPMLIFCSIHYKNIELSLSLYSYTNVALYLLNLFFSYKALRKIGENIERKNSTFST